ncbi:MAG TPA: 50S ribosomal protein L4 [Candidatus Nanoarchaeia archaeon]|nr:50S ribosomal protein L4 [Candidatus Nanoarchaeia archaeon]
MAAKKIPVLSAEGKAVREIALPAFFSSEIREDILQKCLETRKRKQPHAPFYLAGMQKSASGQLKHARRKWKTAYGKGISRIPRKIMWRRGTQFFWIGATISGTRGGRKAHPPKIKSMLKEKSINKKELRIAFLGALAATANDKYIRKRYSSIGDEKISAPFVVDSKILELKAKDFLKAIRNILGSLYSIAIQKKSIRAGKGKLRGRKYKRTAGLLLVSGDNESIRIMGIDVQRAGNLAIEDLAEGRAGRLVIYTENAIRELEKRIEAKSEEGAKK